MGRMQSRFEAKGAERSAGRRAAVALGAFAGMALAALLLAAPVRAQLVFETAFEDGLPMEFDAAGATIESVQGYAGLGFVGNTFEGDFLRYATTEVVDTTLTLTDLPPHTELSFGFLLAVIDSWDGTELLEVSVDGETLFSNWFLLSTGDSSSYVARPGSLLSSGTDLGFTGGGYYDHDRAYDLSLEPAFWDLPHSADQVTIVWSLSAVSGGAAANWQGGGDESWAIDNVFVRVPEPTRTAQALVALLALGLWRRAR